jgi:hypothetical protein
MNPERRLPTLLEMTAALTGSVDEWRKAGFAIASDDEHARRKSICEGCEMWRPNALGGVGRCLECGCAGFKLWMESSKCPLGKWENQNEKKNSEVA